MDGSACAICFQLGGGMKHNIHFSNPQHESTDEILSDLLSTGVNNIILADVSISEQMADKVDQSGANVLLFDHHKSAIPLANRKWCTIEKENNACGSKMLFQHMLDQNKEQTYYNKYKLT